MGIDWSGLRKSAADDLTGCRTVTVQFPSGPRVLIPKAWQREEGEPDKPVFELCGFRVIETVDGKFIAVKDGT